MRSDKSTPGTTPAKAKDEARVERRRPRANERRRAPGAALAAGIAALGAALLALAGAIAAGAGLALALALTLGAAGLALAVGALLLARRARSAAEKASSDLDFLARRLLRVESRLAEAERRKGGDDDVRGAVAEVSGEIALISGLLRDIAGTVAGHDRAIAELADAQSTFPQSTFPQSTFPHASSPHAPMPHGSMPGYVPEPERYEATPAEPAPQEPAAWTAPPQPRFAPVLEPEPERAPEPPPAARVFTPQPLHRAAAEPLFEDDPPEEPEPEPVLDRRSQAVLRALREDRMEIHLQPVVSLPQRKTRFYEALARLRLDDDTLVLPDEFLPAITRAGLTAELDGKVAARAAAIVRHLVNRGSDAFVTLDLAQESLAAPGFLRALGRILEAYPDVAGRLAFEIAQRSWRMLDGEAAASLEALRARGALFVLDRASDLRVDAMGLADRGVRYVKLPATLLLSHAERHAPGLDVAVSDLSALLARAGIKLVAEAVEREEDVPDLIDLDVPLAQGLVFGGPRAVRADLIGGPPAPRGGGQPSAAPRGPEAPGPTARAAPSRSSPPPPGPATGAASGARADALPQPPPEPKRPYRATLRRAG